MTPARIHVAPAGDLLRLRAEWQELQQRAAPHAFQTAAWVFAEAGARWRQAVALRAHRGGILVGLALAGRRRGGLWLTETGIPARDSVFVEHNAPLLARGHEDLAGPCLAALLREAGPAGLFLSGVAPALAASLPRHAARRVLADRSVPFVDLAALGREPDAYLARLSANTRQQLRRSQRAYAAAGPIRVERAACGPTRRTFLDALASLHQARWTARGQPGAFATPAFRAFHEALVADPAAGDLVDLLRITAGERLIGYLYNLRCGGRVYAYQSGFDYAGAAGPEKPGLTCHHAAIETARAAGERIYDFLAGTDRYKTSLATGAEHLLWLHAAPRLSAAGAAITARALLRRR